MISAMKNSYRMGQPYIHPSMVVVQEPEPPKEMKKAVDEKMKSMKKNEPEPWDPSNYSSNEEIIKSVKIFKDFKKDDGKKMSMKEIRQSFDNLDDWVEEMAEKYRQELKKKEDSMFE